MVQGCEGAALDHGAFGPRGPANRSTGLLHPGEQPPRGAVHRLSQVPDLLERLGRCALLFADLTGKSHACPMQLALGDDVQEPILQSYHLVLFLSTITCNFVLSTTLAVLRR